VRFLNAGAVQGMANSGLTSMASMTWAGVCGFSGSLAGFLLKMLLMRLPSFPAAPDDLGDLMS